MLEKVEMIGQLRSQLVGFYRNLKREDQLQHLYAQRVEQADMMQGGMQGGAMEDEEIYEMGSVDEQMIDPQDNAPEMMYETPSQNQEHLLAQQQRYQSKGMQNGQQ